MVREEVSDLELFGFGPHLMIDGFHADSVKLDDLEFIQSVLDGLPNEMGMTKIMAPHATRYGGSSPEDAGVTGIVMIAESHIAIHTFPHKRFISVDVFSCKDFDAARAIARLVQAFDIGRYDTFFFNRGKEFPHDIEAAVKILAGERDYIEARIPV
jgi:S-adenosylmethionine decarboxylase